MRNTVRTGLLHLNLVVVAVGLSVPVVAFPAFAGVGGAREPAAAQTPGALTNADVIELQKVGLSETLIIEKIKSSETAFDLSVAGLKALKMAKVPDAVIAAMMEDDAPASSPAPAAVPPAASDASSQGGSPAVPDEPGVYLFAEDASSLTQVEPTSVELKTRGLWKSSFSFGAAKIKGIAVLRGPSARTQIANRQPTFFLYFGQAALDQSSVVISPNEVVLVKTDMVEGQREFVVSSANISGSQRGVPDHYEMPFDYEKVSAGFYRVVPRQELQDGEYCFAYGGGAGTLRVYDFGIRGR